MKKLLVFAFVSVVGAVGAAAGVSGSAWAQSHELPAESAAGGAGEEAVTNPIQNVGSFSYKDKNAEGGELKPGEHRMPPPFAMVLVNFAILLFILGKYAWPSLKRVVSDRHDDIEKALTEGKRLRAEAQQKLDEYTAKLGSLQAEIDHLTSAIRAEAEAEKKRIISEAEARATRMQREAEQQIDAEIRRVRALLEREVATVAVAAAEKILREKTTEADQRAFADRFVHELQAAARPRPPAA